MVEWMIFLVWLFWRGCLSRSSLPFGDHKFAKIENICIRYWMIACRQVLPIWMPHAKTWQSTKTQTLPVKVMKSFVNIEVCHHSFLTYCKYIHRQVKGAVFVVHWVNEVVSLEKLFFSEGGIVTMRTQYARSISWVEPYTRSVLCLNKLS
jgi:hypothetical protein